MVQGASGKQFLDSGLVQIDILYMDIPGCMAGGRQAHIKSYTIDMYAAGAQVCPRIGFIKLLDVVLVGWFG